MYYFYASFPSHLLQQSYDLSLGSEMSLRGLLLDGHDFWPFVMGKFPPAPYAITHTERCSSEVIIDTCTVYHDTYQFGLLVESG